MRWIVSHGFKVLIVAIAFAASGLIAQDAHAATSGLTISPASVDTQIAPGDSYKGTLTILNRSDSDTRYKVYATPYSVTGEEYKPYFSPIPGATDITKWFSFGSTGGSLAVNGRTSVPYTISVPNGTGAGSYYATVFAETSNKADTGVVTQKRVGMVVYLRVTGNAIEKGSIAQWSVPLLQQPPLGGTLKIANSGSVHFHAKVKVTISDILGRKKHEIVRDPHVLPQKLRNIPISWEKSSSFGLYKVGGEVSYLGKTEKLPTKYVLIASTFVRVLIGSSLLLIVIALVISGRKRVARPKK